MKTREPGRLDVSSRSDVFQRLDAIKRNRAKRKQCGECLVESVAAIDAAVREGWEIRGLIHAGGARLSSWARGLLQSCSRAQIISLAQRLMAELSDRGETSELLAVVGIRRATPRDLPVRLPFTALVLDRIWSPGNLGSILRSCDAFGVSAVVIRGHAADLYDPLTIRSSLGAVFSVPVAAESSNEQLSTWLAGLKGRLPELQIVGTSPSAASPLYECDLTGPTVFVLGNERGGMSAWLRETADVTVSIPSRGTVDSLNVAAAATVVLYELARQRAAFRTGRC